MADLKQLKEKDVLEVFVCYSPFQVFIANIVSSQNKAEAKTKDYGSLLIRQSKIKEMDSGFDAELLMGEGIQNIKSLSTIKKKLKQLAGTSGNISFYIPHTAGVLTYYIFSKLKKEFASVQVNLLYEGILYLYEYDYSYFEKSKQVKFRKLASQFLGLGYEFNANIYPAESENISHIYTPFPEITRGPKSKIKKIDLKGEAYLPVTARVILLGQRSSLFNQEEHQKVYRVMLNEIKKSGCQELFYKRHYSDHSSIFKEIAKEEGISYTEIDPSQPIEVLIEDYRPELVVSMISSALINLKGIFGNSVKLRSFCPRIYAESVRSEIINRMYEVFAKVGIENTDIEFED